MLHIKKYPNDTKSARKLVELIQKRRNMLDYLMRTDYHRYRWVCVDYGIPEQAPKHAHHKTDFRLVINPSRGLWVTNEIDIQKVHSEHDVHGNLLFYRFRVIWFAVNEI